MVFNIKDQHGNVVERGITYQEALMYIDSNVGKYYVMEPVKEDE